MKIWVNGEGRELEERTTIRALVEQLGLGGGPVAVERNGEIVRRADHASTPLIAGDRVEIVHFVGGGS